MKKFISGILAIGITLSSVLSFTSSSAFDPTKDPNGDGHLTIADSTYILQYLGGAYEPDNLVQLDVDNNHVVSVVDSEYIVMHDAGMISSSTEQSVEPASNTLIRRSYIAYNSKTGAFLRNYALSYTESDNATNTVNSNSRAVVEDWNNIGVAKIMFDDGTYGTGFVVDEHTIATAAHNVFYNTTDTVCTIDKILLFNRIGRSFTYTPVESHIPSTYKLANGQSNTDDYALITVKEDLSDYMTFNLGAVTNVACTSSLPIKIIGFPGTYQDTTNGEHSKRLSEGLLVPNYVTGHATNIYHNATAGYGFSGSPIFTTETLNGITYNTVVGIHIANASVGSAGIRFTAPVLKFYNSNPYTYY